MPASLGALTELMNGQLHLDGNQLTSVQVELHFHGCFGGLYCAAPQQVAAQDRSNKGSYSLIPDDQIVLRAWRAECPELRALWDERAPVAAWAGVTFGEAGGADPGRVVLLDLHGRSLTGVLPAAALRGLTALKRLNLDDNRQLTGVVPAALGGITALKRPSVV